MFNQNNGNQPMQPLNFFPNNPQLQQQFQAFAQYMFGKGDPQQLVQYYLNTGRMTQQQFNKLRIDANNISGKNY